MAREASPEPVLHATLFAALAVPFEPEEVKSRTQGGKQLHYITARTAMNRLDDVLGPSNWWDEYTPLENSVVCRLTIRLPDGSLLTKSDAGGYAGMADQGDDDKSGFSDAFKRACVKFGVARYLYRDGVPRFVAEVAGAAAPEGAREPSRREAGPSSGAGNREAAAPARRVDRRPYRQLIEETARDAARKFEAEHPGARPFITPFQLNRHLHKEAVSFGFAPEAGKLTEGQVFTVMTQVYGQQKKWVREELGGYLRRCRAEAERKAATEESGVAVAEGREPGQDG